MRALPDPSSLVLVLVLQPVALRVLEGAVQAVVVHGLPDALEDRRDGSPVRYEGKQLHHHAAEEPYALAELAGVAAGAQVSEASLAKSAALAVFESMQPRLPWHLQGCQLGLVVAEIPGLVVLLPALVTDSGCSYNCHSSQRQPVLLLVS